LLALLERGSRNGYQLPTRSTRSTRTSGSHRSIEQCLWKPLQVPLFGAD